MGIVEWSALGTVVSILVALIGNVVRVMDRLNSMSNRTSALEGRAESNAIGIASAKLELERIDQDLVAHRVIVAREYVSKEMLKDTEDRIVKAIDRLGDRLDGALRHNGS